MNSIDLMMVPTIDTVTATTMSAMKDSVALYGPWMQVLTRRRKPNISGKSNVKVKQYQPLVEGVSKSCFQILEDNGDENEVFFLKGN